MYELQTASAPQKLAAALGGSVVELRELPYGKMRAAMAAADEPGQSADRLLAASLHVDGQPIGYERLQAIPGRFSGAVATALTAALQMHGLSAQGDDDAEDAAPNA